MLGPKTSFICYVYELIYTLPFTQWEPKLAYIILLSSVFSSQQPYKVVMLRDMEWPTITYQISMSGDSNLGLRN